MNLLTLLAANINVIKQCQPLVGQSNWSDAWSSIDSRLYRHGESTRCPQSGGDVVDATSNGGLRWGKQWKRRKLTELEATPTVLLAERIRCTVRMASADPPCSFYLFSTFSFYVNASPISIVVPFTDIVGSSRRVDTTAKKGNFRAKVGIFRVSHCLTCLVFGSACTVSNQRNVEQICSVTDMFWYIGRFH